MNMKSKMLFLLVFATSFILGSNQLCAMKRKGFAGKEQSTQLAKKQDIEEQVEAEGVNCFEWLPDEVLVEIFSYFEQDTLLLVLRTINSGFNSVILGYVPFRMDFSKKKLQKIPTLLYQLKNLRELNLNGKANLNAPFKSVKLSEGLLNGLSKSMKKLSLASCNLDCVPQGLDGLHNLEELDLSYNSRIVNIAGIPESVSVLNLSKCGFVEIPKELLALPHLKKLNLSYMKSYISRLSLVLDEENINFLPASLEELNILMCIISEQALKKLKERLPEATIISSQQTAAATIHSVAYA